MCTGAATSACHRHVGLCRHSERVVRSVTIKKNRTNLKAVRKEKQDIPKEVNKEKRCFLKEISK